MTNSKWYVLHCQARKEESLYKHILTLGFETYYPWIRARPVNPRARKILPYFPGYIFIHADLNKVGESVFNRMPMAIGLISFGGEPASLPDATVEVIERFLSKANQTGQALINNLKPGDKVRIEGGMFSGYEAVFDLHIPGSQRVRVLLKMLEQERTIPVVLPAEMIQTNKDKTTD